MSKPRIIHYNHADRMITVDGVPYKYDAGLHICNTELWDANMAWSRLMHHDGDMEAVERDYIEENERRKAVQKRGAAR